jgi:hypothetical protein
MSLVKTQILLYQPQPLELNLLQSPSTLNLLHESFVHYRLALSLGLMRRAHHRNGRQEGIVSAFVLFQCSSVYTGEQAK